MGAERDQPQDVVAVPRGARLFDEPARGVELAVADRGRDVDEQHRGHGVALADRRRAGQRQRQERDERHAQGGAQHLLPARQVHQRRTQREGHERQRRQDPQRLRLEQLYAHTVTRRL